MNEKTCKRSDCGGSIARRSRDTDANWEQRLYCSSNCHNVQRGREARERLVEDVEWIVDHDNPHSVAKRVGYTNVADLMSRLDDIGHPELSAKLAAGMTRWHFYTEAGVA